MQAEYAFLIDTMRLVRLALFSGSQLLHSDPLHSLYLFLPRMRYASTQLILILNHTVFPSRTPADVLKKQLEALNNELNGVKDKLEVLALTLLVTL